VSYVIAGTFSGLLMASVTAALGPIMLFSLAKDPTPFFKALLDRVPPIYMTLALVVMAYPAWTLVGAVAGILYRVSLEQVPGGGLGSPNMVFTTAIVVVAIMLVTPLALLIRRVIAGLAAMTAIFIGVFGWLLPFMART
jgi:hypothetical protein